MQRGNGFAQLGHLAQEGRRVRKGVQLGGRCVVPLTCDKCMQFLSARSRLEVPTLMTTVTPVTWPPSGAQGEQLQTKG